MSNRLPTFVFALGFIVSFAFVDATNATEDDLEFFERRIRPILVNRCFECHSADSDELGGNLVMDSMQGILRGGDSGPAIDVENLNESLIISAIEYREFEMPPDEMLPEEEIELLRQWVGKGAPAPAEVEGEGEHGSVEPAKASELWSLQPIAQPVIPEVADSDWNKNPIDAFVYQKLVERQIKPNQLAPPEVLLRRVYFDLVGLPPSPQALDEFVKDPSHEHLQAIAQELLGQAQYGERWARHWLDVVRYAESAGSSRDVLMPYAWRYRDYVIDAFNEDLKFDRFIAEQVAGDLIEANDQDESDRLQVATGLLAIGSKSLNGGNLPLDIIDDQIDVVSRAFLGLTVSCARCHDHKFDPIPTADYYALAGVFKSTRTFYGGGTNRPKSVEQHQAQYILLGENAAEMAEQFVTREKSLAQMQKRKTTLTRQVQQLRRQLPEDWEEQLEQEVVNPDKQESEDGSELQVKVDAWREKQRQVAAVQAEIDELGPAPDFEFHYAVGVTDTNRPSNAQIQIRGEKNRAGDVVPRGFLGCVTLDEAHSIESDSSGRLELVDWMTDSQHPLTSRVIVNRVWQHLFGKGLVATVDNFGSTGTQPSHPELLDYLAHRFVHHHQWSMKALIAELVSTRTYQLSSKNADVNYAVDPDNIYRWRMDRRRLEAEPLRDAILAVSGELNLERPEGSLVLEIGEGEVGRNLNTAPLRQDFPHRSVYLPIIRGIVPPFLKAFDFPEPSNIQGQRDVTHIPSQALFLMNSEFVFGRANAFADRIVSDPERSFEERIDFAYRCALGRPPTQAEVDTSSKFLLREMDVPNKEAWAEFCHALFASAEFRFVQ